MRTNIRQNPTPAVKSPSGEQCPAHGWYEPDPETYRLRDEARQRGMPAQRARELYAQAARIRNHCPSCRGPRPTPIEYATSVRLRTAGGDR